MRITCPYCGSRDSREFVYHGEALPRPVPEAADAGEAMFAYVYLRDNPAGRHREHWYHAAGCRGWLDVERDTRTHEIVAVRLAQSEAGR